MPIRRDAMADNLVRMSSYRAIRSRTIDQNEAPARRKGNTAR
jgi:hypothetical protein